MTEKDLISRALTHYRRTYDETRQGPAQMLHKLVLAVDRFQGSPTKDDIYDLAHKYHETPKVVEVVFEAKEDRMVGTKRKRFSPFGDAWLREEDAIIDEMWNEGKPDYQIAKKLNRLRANMNREVTRNAQLVSTRRRNLRAVGKPNTTKGV